MTANLTTSPWDVGNAGPFSEAELDAVLQRIELLVSSAPSTRDFYRDYLAECVETLDACSGSVWWKDSSGKWVQGVAHPATSSLWPPDALRVAHQIELQRVWDTQRSRSIMASELATDHEADEQDLIVPVIADGITQAVVEVLHDRPKNEQVQRGYTTFLEATAELAADYHQLTERQVLRQQLDWQSVLTEFFGELHAELDVRRSAMVIVNQGRRLLPCDRISVFLRRRAEFAVIAVTGAESVDRRSATLRAAEDLAAAVCGSGESLWFHDDTSLVAPQLRMALDRHFDMAHTRRIGVIPLEVRRGDQPQVIGAFTLENFGGAFDSDFRERVELVSDHLATALHNAALHEAVPFTRFASRLLGLSQRSLWRPLSAVLGVVVLMACLLMVPVEHRVACQGELQPSIRREIFSKTQGIVDEVLVAHGQAVHDGDVLLTLHSPQLDLEAKRIWGEIQTVREQLNAVEVAQIESQPLRVDARSQYHRITAEKRELALRLRSLRAQQDILKRQQDELKLTSPIGGRVVTWNLKQQLEGRPIDRGDRLMTVVDEQGPWELQLRIPETKVGIVSEARRHQESQMVTFVCDAEPAVRYRGSATEMALAAQVDETHGSTVTLVVVPETTPAVTRPGATVSAKIHCGRRTLAYVWLHETWDTLRRMLLY